MKNKGIKSYIKDNRIELSIFVLYLIMLALISSFHEHWFDEIQAWLIAKDANVKDIITVITHNEGHPPIWYFILKPFAKLGVACNVGLYIANHTFILSAIYLFLMNAPFKRIYKCILPFTYFFFYQYGVVCRPYCVMMLGFVLAGMFYKSRNDRPIRYLVALLLICFASAYGILLAAGICISWIIEIIDFRDIEKFGKSFMIFIKSKTFKGMLVLLIINIILLSLIIPNENTFAVVINEKQSFIEHVLFTMIILPANAFYMATYSDTYSLKFSLDSVTRIGDLGSGLIFMIFFISIIWYNKKIREFIIPYMMFTIFSALVYFSIHHIGIYTMFFVYILWCCVESDENRRNEFEKIRLKLNEKQQKNMCIISKCIIYGILCVSVYWSIGASFNDINSKYDVGQDIAEFIKKEKIDEYNCMVRWDHINNYPVEGKEYINLNSTSMHIVSSLGFLDYNPYYNYNMGDDELRYRKHCINDDINIYNEWAKKGIPDFILGDDTPINKVFEGVSIKNNYTLIKIFEGNICFKTEKYKILIPLYIRNDLMSKYPHFKDLGDFREYEEKNR